MAPQLATQLPLRKPDEHRPEILGCHAKIQTFKVSGGQIYSLRRSLLPTGHFLHLTTDLPTASVNQIYDLSQKVTGRNAIICNPKISPPAGSQVITTTKCFRMKRPT